MNRHLTPDVHEAATLTGHMVASQLHPGDMLGSRFRIESLLGIGGMGVVYRARDLSLDIDVALKLLRPELARRPESFESFRRELLLARQVSSPHVVRIHDIAEDAGRWFISMDFIDGESLERRLDRARALPVEQALSIVHGLLDGLSAAHQRGVVHRDLKPGNVLIDAEGRAYITDFGIARSLGATGLTQTGMIVGTPEYLSPEQARGQTVDARSDLYAVGLILYEMLVGELPFSGGTPAETVIQRILRPPPSLAQARPDLPGWLHAFSDRLLKVNPAHRFESAKAAIRALEFRRVPRAPLNWPALAAGLLALVVVGAAGTWLWRNPHVLTRLVTPAVATTPHIGVLPVTAPKDDADLGALARALDAHMHAWLRGDPSIAAVPRRRILGALARVAPDASEETLLRQLPDIAQAAHATKLWRGSLSRGANGAIVFHLGEPGATSSAPLLEVSGTTPEAVFAAYLEALPKALASQRLHAGQAPALPADAAVAFGYALRELDKGDAKAALARLASIPAASATGALVQTAWLDAEEADHQTLPAQNTREAAIKRFANATDPASRQLHARALAGDGEDAEALQALASAMQAYPHDSALALLDVDTLAANGDTDKAMKELEKLVAKDDQDARAWFLLGRTAIQQGQPRIAVEDYLIRALVLYSRSGDAAAEAETRNALGIGYDRLGQPDDAIEQYMRAAATRERLGDQIGLSKTLRNLAVVQAVSGHRDEAEKTLDRAKSILEQIGDRASLGDLYNDRGVIAEENGDFAAALAAYREALAIRQQLDIPDAVAESLDNVGFASFQLGRFDDAAVYWQQALALYQKLDDRNKMLRVEQNISVLDTARGHFAAARERLQKLLRQAQDSQLTEAEAVALVNLAELALAEGDFADASTYAARAVQTFKRRSDLRGQAEAHLLEARAQLAVGDTSGVDTTLQAVSTADLGVEQKAALLLAQARRAELGGDFKAAGARLDEAADAAAEAHSGAIDMRVRLQRVHLALASGDIAKANELLKSIAGETNRLGEIPLRLQWLELETATALRNGKRAEAASWYRQAVALLKDVGDYAYATTIHALGALALPPGAEADAARNAAATARKRMLEHAPSDARASLEAELDHRLHTEAALADADAH